MLRSRADQLTVLVGGIGLVAIVNAMAVGRSSTFFYPKTSALWLICSLALVMRVGSVNNVRPVSAPRGIRQSAAQIGADRRVALEEQGG